MEETKKHCCCCVNTPEADAAADTAVGNALDRPVRDALVTYLKTIFGERITELRQMRMESSVPVRRKPRSSRPKACTETPALS